MSTHPVPNTDNLQAYIKAQLAELPLPGAIDAEADASTTEKVHSLKILDIAQRASKLPPVTDADSLEKNQKALTTLVRIRTGLDKARKAMLEPFTAIKAQVDAYVGTNASSGLQARIAEIEEPIRERIEAYKAAEERKRQEAQRIIDERNKARERAVLAAGMAWDGQSFKYADMVLWPTDLRNYSEEQWSAFKQKLDQVVEADRLAREEAKRKEAEQAAAMKAEAERLAKEREELEALRQQMRSDLNRVREQQLDALVGSRCDFILSAVPGLPPAAGDDLTGWNDQQWQEVLRLSGEHLKKLDADREAMTRERIARDEVQGRIRFRREQLEAFGAKQEGERMVLDHLQVPMTDLRDMDVVHWDLVKAQFDGHVQTKKLVLESLKHLEPIKTEKEAAAEAAPPVVDFDRILRVLVGCRELLPYIPKGATPDRLSDETERIQREVLDLIQDIETLQAHGAR